MLLANLEKLCLQQCCAKGYLLFCQQGLYVCLPGSLSGALVNLEVVIRSVVDDEDRLWWHMWKRQAFFCKTAVSKNMSKKSRLTCITKHVIRLSPSFRFSFSVISDKK